MRPVVKSVSFEPDPQSLPADPAEFDTLATVVIGEGRPDDGEVVYVQVCTPEALQRRCKSESIVSGHGLLIVDWEQFDQELVESWLRRAVERIEAPTWDEIGARLATVGWWEFEQQ